MKKFLFFVMAVLVTVPSGYSQNRVTFTETFNSTNCSFTRSPQNSWLLDTVLNVSGKAAWGFVPNAEGDSIELISPVYDLSKYSYAYLRFSHICKVSDLDYVAVEYRENYVGSKWKAVSIADYRGASTAFRRQGRFSHESYLEWQKADLMAEPDNSWWKVELFDISQDVAYAEVQFRFIIRKGSTVGTNFAWGWFIDNFELIVSTMQINPPVVQFVQPLTNGLVFGPGPYTIYAKAAKRTICPLNNPVLRLTYTALNGSVVRDSILMTAYEGDSMWMAVIPPQKVGTQVAYTVYAADTVGNNNIASSGYTIGREWGLDSNCVALLSIDSPFVGALTGQANKVCVTIQNRGLSNLTSALIRWRVNGVDQTPMKWTGNLPEGFSGIVYLGTYVPVNSVDTIEATVSLPNNDPVNNTGDTAASKNVYACSSYISGIYTVGPNEKYTSIGDVMELIRVCGVNGDVNISVTGGIYPEVLDFSDLWYPLSGHKLTVTSATGNANDVVITGTSAPGTKAYFKNSRNIVLTNLTFEGTGTGILFEEDNENIEISHCRILLDTETSTTYAGIAIPDCTPDKIRILDNYIRGAYYGLYTKGVSATQKMTNITFCNNTLVEPYYGTLLYYTDFDYVDNNRIYSRSKNAVMLFGLDMTNCNAESVSGNRIITMSPVSQGQGIYASYFNEDSSRAAVIANNEIIYNVTAACYGIDARYSQAEFYHNTVIMYGSAASYGLYCTNTMQGMDMHFYNNNFVCYNNGYPVYFTGKTLIGLEILMDYNNCYGNTYVGYFGVGITDVNVWSQQVQDQHAVNVNPLFYDYTVSGKCANYTGLICPVGRIVRDILDSVRYGSTAIGCYTSQSYDFDVLPLSFEAPAGSVTINQSAPVKVRIMNNSSKTSLTSVRVNWTVNGKLQTPYDWKGSLAPYQDTLLNIGNFLPAPENNILVVWTEMPNGMRSDDYRGNDTVRTVVYGCAGPMAGVYTIGAGKDFATIEEAMGVISICGVGGPLTFKLEKGTYGPLTLNQIAGVNSKNTLTFTSVSGNASDVVFTGASPVITISNSSHVRITHVTVDALNYTYAIRIMGASKDVQVKCCNISLNPKNTSGQYGIYANNDGSIRDSVLLVGNRIDGGYYGIYFYGGTGSPAAQHGRYNRVDSNTVSNVYYYSIYLCYADCESVSHNVITDRMQNNNTAFYGIYSYYCNQKYVTNNFVNAAYPNYTGSVAGVYISYSNYSTYAQSTTDTTYILNNDARVHHASSNYTYPIYANYTGNTQIMHNSAYATSTGNYGYGIYSWAANPYYCQLRNNNVYMVGGTTGYPLYCGGTIGYFQMSGNNIYREKGNNLAYMGGARTTLAQVQNYDKTATSVMPDYIDLAASRQVCSNKGITAAPVTNLYYQKYGYRDLLDSVRPSKDVTRGAYEVTPLVNDARLVTFLEPSSTVLSYGTSTDVKVVLYNRGDSALTSCVIGWDVNGVSQTAVKWTGSLYQNQSIAVKLGSLQVLDSTYVITAYASDPNGKKDDFPGDNTISIEAQGCVMQLNGTYVVGNSKSADMPFERAVRIIEKCGVSGPVTLKVENGTYRVNMYFSTIIGMSDKTPITVTSLSGDSSDVVIEAAAEAPAMVLGYTHNFTVSHVTVSGFSGGSNSTAIQLVGGNKHLTIRGCHLNTARLNSQKVADVAVYSDKPSDPDTVLVIAQNTITGNGGIYLYGNSSARSYDVRIDSNRILSPYHHAIYTYYYDIRSINNNFIHKEANESVCQFGIYPQYTYGVARHATTISNNRVHGNYFYSLYMSNNYSMGYTSWNINYPLLITNNEFIFTGSNSGYNFTFWNSGGYLIIANNTLIVPQGASRTYMMSIWTYNPGHFKCMNNNFVNYGNCTNIFHTNMTNQNTYMDVWDYNNYWIGNGQFSYNGATFKTVSGFSNMLGNNRDANSTERDPRILYADSIAKPTSWAGMLCPPADSVYTDILGMQRSTPTYKGCYSETFNVDAAMMGFVEPSFESVSAGDPVPVKVSLKNVGKDTISTLTIRWTVDGVAQTPVSLANMKFASQETREVSIGSFIAGSNRSSTTIVVWSENPNGRPDNNTNTDTIRRNLLVCSKALAGKYVVGPSAKADFADLGQVVSLLNYCGISAPVVIELESGSYPAIEMGNIAGASATNTITFTSVIRNREAVVIGAEKSPSLALKGSRFVRFEDVTIGNTTGSNNLVAVSLSGYIDDVMFRHCNLYAYAAATSNNSMVVDYSCNTAANATNYLKNVRFIGNEVRGGYYGFYLYYAGGNANNCKTSAMNRASVRIDSNYIYDQYYYAVYSYHYSHVESFSHNTVVARSSASYHYGAYFYYNLVDSISGNHIRQSVNYSYSGLQLHYLNNTSYFGSDILPAVVDNNEMVVRGQTYAYGFYIYYCNALVANNSVYCNGPTNYALYLGTTSNGYKLEFINNILMTEGGSTNNYLIYCSAAATLTTYPIIMDYNDYYTSSSKKTAFYCGSAQTFATWKTAYNMEAHSLEIKPDFHNLPEDLSIGQFDDRLKCNRHSRVMRDINNGERTSLTIMGAYSIPLFEGYDLQAEVFVEPTVGGIQCFPDRTPVKLGIYNMGTYNADFTAIPVTLCLKCESDSVNFVKKIILNNGGIGIMKRDTFELEPAMDITYPGLYRLTAWLEWAKDQNSSDDTLNLDYYVDKTVLPYDNDFTGTFAGVATNQAYGDISWDVVNSNPVIAPVYGTGSLLFRSSEARGSISQALFTSVSLQGTYNPRLYFWYAHDNRNPYQRDQMDVRISQDGGATFRTLQTLYRYDAKCAQPTWKEYRIDLSNYQKGNCIIIAFTAYSYGGGDQTVDRVRIVAQQDMRVLVDTPKVSDFVACNLTGRSLTVYLENLTGQKVPFKAGDSVTVEMSGASNFVYKKALTGRLENRETDTLTLAPIDYVGGGQFDVKVYVNSVDSNAANDTAKFSLNLNPDLAVVSHDAIGYTEPGDTVYVGFTMKNTGNLDIVTPFDVRVVVNREDTVVERISQVLKPGDTLYHRFGKGIIVPMTTADQPYYLLDVAALLPCDADGDNDTVRIIGNVNIIDNGILSITAPVSGQCAMGGELSKIEVRLFNNGNVDNTDSVVLTAVIDSAGKACMTLTEKIAPMYAGENRNYTFRQQYRVPRLSVNGARETYRVTVYMVSLDGDFDRGNDTASVEACVEGGVGIGDAVADRWTVGQNVPNPASDVTRIPYELPEAGVLTLRIMGLNGQVLYREEMQTEAGSGDIRVNVSDFASGVYYYSVEYCGERVVRKMNIVR